MASQFTYRALSTDGLNEPQRGLGQGNYISDLDAVAQAIRTRLLLFQGEWWSDLADGTPYWQKILGVAGAGKNQQATNLALQSRILGTPFVTGIQNLQSSFNPSSRQYKFYAQVQTVFGIITVSSNNIPVPPNRSLSS